MSFFSVSLCLCGESHHPCGEASGVAGGDGDGVGDVGGVGRLVQAELGRHGELDLLLGGVAVAGDGFFDGGGRQVFEFEAGLGGGEEDDAARVGHEDRGPRVLVVGVELLDGEAGGPEFPDQRSEVGVQLREALCHGGFGVELEDAGLDEARVEPAGGDVEPAQRQNAGAGLLDLVSGHDRRPAAIGGAVRPVVRHRDPQDFGSSIRRFGRPAGRWFPHPLYPRPPL